MGCDGGGREERGVAWSTGHDTAGWVGDAVAVMVEVEGGGGNAKSEIITQVTGVMICHTSLN
jgi:hypothetical protein